MRTIALACVLPLLLAGAALGGGGPLDVFKPLCGKTWRGEFTGPDGARMTDVSRWELVLGGKAVRTVHSLNDGMYGGETLMYWDPQQGTVAFTYVTTAGFRTDGTITIDGRSFTSHETVSGDAGGITEVRATARLKDDGTMEMVSEYLRDGAWVPGHTIRYVEAPEAEVRFE